MKDWSLAEDVVQDAFVSLWRSAGSFAPERSRARTWLLTLVHRRAVDIVRREERRRTEPLRPSHERGSEDLDETLERELSGAEVRVALRSLSAENRQALELAYFGGLTQTQLATHLNEPLGTIKSRMFSGLRQLRLYLGEGGA